MSQEIFEIVRCMDLDSITTQVVLQCAPLISGLKISNLLIIQNQNMEELQEILKNTNLLYYIFYKTEKKTTLLLYRENDLGKHLSKIEVRKFLYKMKYKEISLKKILPNLKVQYSQYMCNKTTFPHEMGVLLGYPIEDIEGFMKNEGKNFLHTGYWKVYQNKSAKVQIFKRFEEAKENMIKLVACGLGIREIMLLYKEQQVLSNVV